MKDILLSLLTTALSVIFYAIGFSNLVANSFFPYGVIASFIIAIIGSLYMYRFQRNDGKFYSIFYLEIIAIPIAAVLAGPFALLSQQLIKNDLNIPVNFAVIFTCNMLASLLLIFVAK